MSLVIWPAIWVLAATVVAVWVLVQGMKSLRPAIQRATVAQYTDRMNSLNPPIWNCHELEMK